jgi:hypothetical protein
MSDEITVEQVRDWVRVVAKAYPYPNIGEFQNLIEEFADQQYQNGFRDGSAYRAKRYPKPEMVRVLRVIEMVGPRDRIEATIAKSEVKGTKTVGDLTFREAIVGEFPEVMEQANSDPS